jgi:hypothetical protein
MKMLTHSEPTVLEIKTQKKLRSEKAIEIISMVYGQRRVLALVKIDIQAGTGQKSALQNHADRLVPATIHVRS